MKKKFKRYRVRLGQSLIEVLIAFTVSVVVGIALVSAGLTTQRASISARNKSQATKLAQEYLEEVRLIRDVTGFTALPSDIKCYKVNTSSGTDPSAWLIQSLAGSACTNTIITTAALADQVTLNNTIFSRGISFTVITANVSVKVLVTVVWAEGVNTRTVSEETTLSKWCGGAVTAGGPCL